MSAKNFMSYGDAETVLTGFANAIKNIKDGSELDSFGDVEVALLDKADTSDLGTAAAKDSTNSVTSGSTDLVESGAVREAIDASVAAAYHHAGTKTVAQLTHDLLVAANEGNVYNITDSGTTTSDFIEGIGKKIDAGDNVGICKVGNVYMFDLLSGLEDTSIFVQKSQTSGLLKNDGTVNTTIEDTVAGHTMALAGKQDKYDTITYAQWQAMTPEQQAAKDYYISDYPSSVLTAGNIAYDNTTSGMAANKVQGAIDELKSETDKQKLVYVSVSNTGNDYTNLQNVLNEIKRLNIPSDILVPIYLYIPGWDICFGYAIRKNAFDKDQYKIRLSNSTVSSYIINDMLNGVIISHIDYTEYTM